MTSPDISPLILDFAATCRVSLDKYELSAACRRITRYLSQHLLDATFLEACFTTQDWEGRKVIYRDERLGFCICAHINTGFKEASPHNHGETWAIYGQAEGQTDMSEWEETEKAGVVRKSKSYMMNPGDAHLYPQGMIHSPKRSIAGKLVRIEGQDMDTVSRNTFTPE